MKIPKVDIAIIGGSSIIGSGFPDEMNGVSIITKNMVFETPFGPSAPFTYASVENNSFLFVPFHGITQKISNTEPDSAGERVFYVFLKARVKKIISTALCGSINPLLDPGDVLIPDGFVDYTTKRSQSLYRAIRAKGEEIESISYRLHQAFCPRLSRLLQAGSKKSGFVRIFPRGVVGVAEGPRLESPSEIRSRYTNQSIDVVTMNLVPEVFFAREIGACYAALELISNYGEGVVSTQWTGKDVFADFQRRWRKPVAEALLYVVEHIDPNYEECGCSNHRWHSILG